MWDINVNAHYLFPVAKGIKVYPLVGVCYTNWSSDAGYSDMEGMEGWGDDIEDEGSDSSGKFGVNLGGGVQYDINDRWAVNFELKYQLISNFNQAVFGIGVAYKF